MNRFATSLLLFAFFAEYFTLISPKVIIIVPVYVFV